MSNPAHPGRRDGRRGRLRAGGLSWAEVEERLGYCAAVIWRNFRRNGLSARPLPIGGRHRWPEEREQRFLALIVGGMRVVKAGRMVGVGKKPAIGKWHRMQAAKARHNEIGRS